MSGGGGSVAGEVYRQAFDSLAHLLSRWNVATSSTKERLETAIADHEREVRIWSEEISFKDLQKPKATSQVFVPLDIYLLPRRQRLSAQEEFPSAPLSAIQIGRAHV